MPAWSLLERESISSLLTLDAELPSAIRVANSVSAADIIDVPIMLTVRLMVERAQANGGIALTKGGAMSRADVRAMFDATEWPDYDKATLLAVNKVLNEADVLPVEFTRIVAHEAKLLRRYKGRLLPTKRSVALLEPENSPELYRSLLETAFWRINLAYFDRMPASHWPQTHMGVVLWSLSVAAHHWAKPEDLLVACTMSDDGLAAAATDFPAFAMVTRVLRPLTWFGLLECAEPLDADVPKWRQPRLYRKTPLFDRVLSFGVSANVPRGSMQ